MSKFRIYKKKDLKELQSKLRNVVGGKLVLRCWICRREVKMDLIRAANTFTEDSGEVTHLDNIHPMCNVCRIKNN